MTSAHPQYNYNRRNSASAPYTVPPKHHHHHKHTHSHSHSHSHTHTPSHSGQAGFQPLSRDFVVRRISEGETGRLKEELKCESCGKGYKHISSLAKHLWEHTPEWNVTKKLLLSKHQQVQLLEAASILVGMNEPAAATTTTNAQTNATGTPSRRNLEYFSPISEDDDYEQVVSSDTSYTPITPIDKSKESTEAAQIKRFSTGYENTSIKSRRAGSVSQYPPSFLSGKKEVNEPGVHSTFEGGYLDTNAEDDSNNNDDKKSRSLSIVLNHESRHRLEDSGLVSPNSRRTYSDAPLHPPVFSPSPSASTHSSPKTEAQESGSLENSIDEIVN